MNRYEDTITIKTKAGKEMNLLAVFIDQYPDICPYCHTGIDSKYCEGFVNDSLDTLRAVFHCPRKVCNQHFLIEYSLVENFREYGKSRPLFEYKKPLTGNFKSFLAHDDIKSISPKFEEIYNQALEALHLDLNEIAGMGMRKALEFLVKDYCINHLRINKDDVEKSELGKCINNYIDNLKIKEISSRAAWLGNDQSHYYKKWPEKTTEDFQELIEAMIAYVELELVYEKATGMKGGK
jgi:hypothetical protein